MDAPLIYLILTASGKPVFASQGDESAVVRYTAVIQAIVACFDSPNELQLVQSGAATIAVQPAFPLILVAVDRLSRSAAQLRGHLELLYAQILSVLTKQQLEKQYRARPALDLRPLLGGTEVFLTALVRNMQRSTPWTWLGALESLEMRRSQRARVNAALLESRQSSSLLYGLVASDGKFAGVVRPKQHSLHPPDLHLVFNMVFSTPVFRESEHWVPICFPRFNPNGFLYAYIRLIVPPQTYLVLVSADRHGFFEMQKVAERFLARLDAPLSAAIAASAARGRIDVDDAQVRPVEYFVYKSRSHVQFIQSSEPDETPKAAETGEAEKAGEMTKPSEAEPSEHFNGEPNENPNDPNDKPSDEPNGEPFDEPNDEPAKEDLSPEDEPSGEDTDLPDVGELALNKDDTAPIENLSLRFAQLQARMVHQRLRICWLEHGAGSILGWHTPAFELYCYAATTDKDAVSQAVKKLVAWIRKHETRLFIVDGATF